MGALRLDALHDALDGALAEIVRAGLHRQAVHADRDVPLLGRIVGAGSGVIPGLVEHTVGDVVLARAIALDYGLDEVLGDVVEIREELLGVLREAVAAVAETGVVVMGADARVAADSFDNRLRIKTFHFRIGIQFVEITDAQGEVRVREQFDRLGLGGAHQEDGDIGVQRRLFQEAGESLRRLAERSVATDDDARRIKIVIQRLRLAKELRREEDLRRHDAHRPVGLALAVTELLARRPGVPYGNGRLDDHHRIRIDLQDHFYDLLDVGSVEEILLGVVVGGGGDDDEVGIAVRGAAVERRLKAQLDGPSGRVLPRQIALDIFVPYR